MMNDSIEARLGSDQQWHTRVQVGFLPDGSPDVRRVKRATEEELLRAVEDLLTQAAAGTLPAKRTRVSSGEGSIRQASDGKWHVWVTVGHKPDGTVDRRHIVRPTRSEAAAAKKKLEAARDSGRLPVAGRKPTVAAWLRTWLETSRITWEPATFSWYESHARVHCIPRLGKFQLDRITADDVSKAYAAMEQDGVGPATIRAASKTLAGAFSEAVARGLMPVSPIGKGPSKARAPRYEAAEIQPLTQAEARKLITAAAHTRNGAAFILALSLGLRRGEVIGLRWQDLSMIDGTLRVRTSLSRHKWRHGCDDPHLCGEKRHKVRACKPGCGRHRQCPPPCPPDCTRHASACPKRAGGGLVLGSPKSRAGKRLLPLVGPLRGYLEGQLRAQYLERETAMDQWRDNDLVFATEFGEPIDPRRHTADWHKLLATAGVREARLHDARHTSATLMLVQGVDARTVMDLFGWSTVAMVHRYQHVVDELKTAAAVAVNDALFGGTATRTAPS